MIVRPAILEMSVLDPLVEGRLMEGRAVPCI